MKKITLLFLIFLGTIYSYGQCAAPTITVGTITDTTIEITWAAGADTYNYSEMRFAATSTNPFPANGGAFIGGGSDSQGATVSATSLLSGTEYTFTVRYNCPDGTGGTTALETLAVTATTTGTPPTTTDTYDFTTNPQGQFFVQAASFGIDITYTSEDAPIAVGAISLILRSNVNSDAVIGTYTNTEELQIGVDQTATITLDNFPADYLNSNSVLLASTTTAGDSSNGTVSTQSELGLAFPGANNYFYYVASQATTVDTNWTPISIPSGNRFFQIELDQPLSTESAEFSSVKVYPNPTTDGILNISGLKDAQTITIHNIVGQQVKRFRNRETINVSDLNTGIYFLQTDNGLKRKILVN